MALVKDLAEVQSTHIRFGGNVQTLRLDKLEVDTRFQRPMSEKRVSQMSETFDPNLVGLLTVSARPNGKYVILDGQHRWMLLVTKGFEQAVCEVLEGLTFEQEASIFHGRNVTRTRLAPGDHFRAQLAGKDETAVAIDKLVRAAGFFVDLQAQRNWKSKLSTEPRSIVAINALQRVYGLGLLGQTLLVIRKAWANETTFFMKSDLILGVGAFLRVYPEAASDPETIAKRWAKASPHNILAAALGARGSQLMGHHVTWQAVLDVLRQLYNRNQRTRLSQRETTAYSLARRGKQAKDYGARRKDTKGKFARGKVQKAEKGAA